MEISIQSNRNLSLVKAKLKKEEFTKQQIEKAKLYNINPIDIIPCKPNREETYLLKWFCEIMNINYNWSRKFKAPIITDNIINKHGFIQNYNDIWYFIYQDKMETISINYIDNIQFINKYKDILSIKQLRILFGINMFNYTRRKINLI